MCIRDSYGTAPESYRKEITERVRNLREKYGLNARLPIASAKSWKSPQMKLQLNEGDSDAPNENRYTTNW